MEKISQVLIYLLKGVIYKSQQEVLWLDLLAVLPEAQEYFGKIGLEVYVDELEGFAFLRQKSTEENTADLKLIQKRPLSYSVSLLCLLLRKYLLEQDVQGGLLRPIISQEKIIEMMSVYFPEKHNEAKLTDQIESAINKVIELGFLRILKQQEKIYEIQRIIKAFIDADWLQQLDEKLENYKNANIND
jgi:hypothetical protein